MLSFYNAWVATPLMAVEFLALGFLCCLRFKRHEYFWLRFLSFAAMEVAVVILVEFFYSVATGGDFHYGQQQGSWDYRQSIFKFFFFTAIYAMTFLALKVSYKEKVSTLFLAAASAFASQHIAHNVAALLNLFVDLSENPESLRWLTLLIQIACVFIVLGIVGISAFLTRSHPNPYKGNAKRKIVVSSIVIVVCVGLYRINVDLPSVNTFITVGFSLYAIVSCTLLLLLFFGLRKSDETHAEAEAYRAMLAQQKAQYELSKRNIDLINHKCHDLKHQIQALQTSSNQAHVQEIERAIMIYDASLQTGNEVLDVLLREKLLECEAEGITMTCFLDGKALRFLEEMDIYSLFGNLLSNAFESASLLQDKSKRTIVLSSRQVGNMFFLHEENYVAGELSFVDGLPKSTKGDEDYHGFGMKSMRRIATKYHGEMSVKCQGEKFSVDFIFPLS